MKTDKQHRNTVVGRDKKKRHQETTMMAQYDLTRVIYEKEK